MEGKKKKAQDQDIILFIKTTPEIVKFGWKVLSFSFRNGWGS